MAELVLRLGCVGLLVLSGLISARYGWKVGSIKRVAYGRREGAVLAAIRGAWVAVAVAMPVLYALRPEWLDWGSIPAPVELRGAVGTGLGAAHAALLVSAHRALGPSYSSSLCTHDDHRLVISGPYRWVRHPIYGAALLLYAALGILSANWVVAIAGITFILFILCVRTPREEQMLLDTFGAEFSAYRQRTGYLLPRIRWR
jgi:protein-S-isoprenylcysteine O-methyltransferase Ste14